MVYPDPAKLGKALALLALCVPLLAVADTSWDWCPKGGEHTFVKACITVEDTGSKNSWGETIWDLRNTCSFPVFVHGCWKEGKRGVTEAGLRYICPDPPKPRFYRLVMPTPRDADQWEMYEGSNVLWVVRCR